MHTTGGSVKPSPIATPFSMTFFGGGCTWILCASAGTYLPAYDCKKNENIKPINGGILK